MPKNTTDKTFMWRGGKTYPPGSDIPDDLAESLGVIASSNEEEELRVLVTEEEAKPQSSVFAPQSSKKERKP